MDIEEYIPPKDTIADTEEIFGSPIDLIELRKEAIEEITKTSNKMRDLVHKSRQTPRQEARFEYMRLHLFDWQNMITVVNALIDIQERLNRLEATIYRGKPRYTSAVK